MTQYVIEKNVPMPSNLRRVGTRYPFAMMAVGDSFAVSIDPQTSKTINRVIARLCTASTYFCKGSYRGRFTIRLIRAEGVVRVWRVS